MSRFNSSLGGTDSLGGTPSLGGPEYRGRTHSLGGTGNRSSKGGGKSHDLDERGWPVPGANRRQRLSLRERKQAKAMKEAQPRDKPTGGGNKCKLCSRPGNLFSRPNSLFFWGGGGPPFSG
jgi:hypothetical protein